MLQALPHYKRIMVICKIHSLSDRLLSVGQRQLCGFDCKKIYAKKSD